MATEIWLPGWYLAGFRARPMPGEEGRVAWVYRAATGAWARAPMERDPARERHFNDAAALDGLAPLGEELAQLGPALGPLLEAGFPADRPLAPSERSAMARLVALLAVRNARRGAVLPLEEARQGVETLSRTVVEMGFVFWRPPPGVFFVTSSSPFHAAFPAPIADQTAGFDLSEPSVELTLPLLPRWRCTRPGSGAASCGERPGSGRCWS